jgi:nicotinamidase-related amidase
MSSHPSVTGISFFTIDPRRCALIVIDMQNAFVAEGAVFETPGARAMIPLLEQLIQFARASRIPIIWTQSDHRPPYGGLMLASSHPSPKTAFCGKESPAMRCTSTCFNRRREGSNTRL